MNIDFLFVPFRLDSFHHLSCFSPLLPHAVLHMICTPFASMLLFLLPSPCSPFPTVHHSSSLLPILVPLQLPVSLCPQTTSVSLLPAFLLRSFCPPLPCFTTSATSFSLFSFLYHSDYYSVHRPSLLPLQTQMPAP